MAPAIYIIVSILAISGMAVGLGMSIFVSMFIVWAGVCLLEKCFRRTDGEKNMYCPLCGSELEIHDLPPAPEIDWSVDMDDDELQKKLTAQAKHPKRQECTCSKGCFQEDFPLYFHHPLRGIDSAPGDSWSLSWVK